MSACGGTKGPLIRGHPVVSRPSINQAFIGELAAGQFTAGSGLAEVFSGQPKERVKIQMSVRILSDAKVPETVIEVTYVDFALLVCVHEGRQALFAFLAGV